MSKRSLRRVLFSSVLVVFGVLSIAPAAVAQQPPTAGQPAQYIVVLREGVDALTVAHEHANLHGLTITHVYRHALRGYAAPIPAGRLARISADPRVLFVSEDRPVSAFAQTVPTGVRRIGGASSSTGSGDGVGVVGVRVAVIDTGIDRDHPDLTVAGGVNCQKGNSYDDGNGHGTHVAGTIGAIDNGSGVVGVAPGAWLYAVRVLNNAGFGSWSSIICGIDWITEFNTVNPSAKILVANMSLGGSGADEGNCGNNKDALHAAICASVATGVTYVVAAGNSTADFKGFVPAAYDEVLTVTAVADFNGESGGGAAATCRTDEDDSAANFSNYTIEGSADEGHTIAAPGVCILSTWKSGGYATISGTSMAAPHVTGTVALCLSGACSGKTPSQVIATLRGDAMSQPEAYGFQGDPNAPLMTRRGFETLYYGYLVNAGNY